MRFRASERPPGVRLRRAAAWILAAAGLLGCAATPQGPEPLSDRPAAQTEVTILFTTDEHGWLLPHEQSGVERGGASRLYHQLLTEEGLCAEAASASQGRLGTGPAPSPAPPEGGPDRWGRADGLAANRCVESRSLLLSGGDSFTGPAISSFFKGASMAHAMARLGYAASAFGNHELDFGRTAFEANRSLSGVRYLAANITPVAPHASPLTEPFTIVQRAGVDIGIVGIATVDTPRTAVASRFAQVRFEDPEEALKRVVPEVWKAGADVVVLLVHECAHRIEPALERNPQWRLSFVGAGHCHERVSRLVGTTPVLSPGWRLDRYARARLRVNATATGPRQAQVVDWGLVDVDTPGSDPVLDRWVAGWRAEVDRALGEVVGFSTAGLDQSSPVLANWVLLSWLAEIEADVAVSTRGAIRQELPPGPVTIATIYSLLPFENELVVARVPGAVLREMVSRPSTRSAGLTRREDGTLVTSDGSPLEDGRAYRVVTTEFLYRGGDDCPFHLADPDASFTGVPWRAPVIRWTRSLGTSESLPLEAVVGRAAPPDALRDPRQK